MPIKHDPDGDSVDSRLERVSWLVVLVFYVPTKLLLRPLRKYAPEQIYTFARILLDGITWLGIWFLIHDVMLVRSKWGSESESDVSHRAFVAYLVISLFSAVLAVAILFIINGYLHDKFLNEPM